MPRYRLSLLLTEKSSLQYSRLMYRCFRTCITFISNVLLLFKDPVKRSLAFSGATTPISPSSCIDNKTFYLRQPIVIIIILILMFQWLFQKQTVAAPPPPHRQEQPRQKILVQQLPPVIKKIPRGQVGTCLQL